MAFKFENNIKQHLCLLKEFFPLVNYQTSLPEAILSNGRCWKKTQTGFLKIANTICMFKYLRLLCNLQRACNSF